MKIEDIKKIHLKLLKNECNKLYKLKFPWADQTLLEKLVEKRYHQVIEAMDAEEYKKDIEELLD
tara:strand:- start:667 stop:858 length:192 start_codon:yes stop_codon:yes gene_type:complete